VDQSYEIISTQKKSTGSKGIRCFSGFAALPIVLAIAFRSGFDRDPFVLTRPLLSH
jgi:hypothetical protein